MHWVGLKIQSTLGTAKESIWNKELIPETSEIGPVPQLGVCPDFKVQLNFDFPEFSFAHLQNVESSKSQSSTWDIK